MKLTSKEKRNARALMESGLRDLEGDKGRPATAKEVKEVYERAVEVVEMVARRDPKNR